MGQAGDKRRAATGGADRSCCRGVCGRAGLGVAASWLPPPARCNAPFAPIEGARVPARAFAPVPVASVGLCRCPRCRFAPVPLAPRGPPAVGLCRRLWLPFRASRRRRRGRRFARPGLGPAGAARFAGAPLPFPALPRLGARPPHSSLRSAPSVAAPFRAPSRRSARRSQSAVALGYGRRSGSALASLRASPPLRPSPLSAARYGSLRFSPSRQPTQK